MTALRARMQDDLLRAVAEQDTVTVSVLRTTLAALANAEAVDPASQAPGATEVPRRMLTDDDVAGILASEQDELERECARMRDLGRGDVAGRLAAQLQVLRRYSRR